MRERGKKSNPKKGEWGYIDLRKRHYIYKTILFIAIGLGIFIFGLLMNKMSNRNIFTVLAILMVLPGGKALVEAVVFFPFHTMDESRYQAVKSQAGENRILYTDIVLTSREKVMNLNFMTLGNGSIIGLAGGKGQDAAYIGEFLLKGVKQLDNGYTVKIFTEEAKFLHAMGSAKPATPDEAEEAVAYLKSLMVE